MPGLILLRGASVECQIANLKVCSVFDFAYLAHGTAVDLRKKIAATKDVFLQLIKLVRYEDSTLAGLTTSANCQSLACIKKLPIRSS